MFVARDVALLLGYQDTDQAIRSHCRAAVSCPVSGTGQVRAAKVIPERDVYRLIMRSRMPNAEAFEEWVVGEVLPSIRRDGGYMAAGPAETPEELMLRALKVAQATVDRQREQLALAQQKADALDRLEGGDGSMCITAAAKVPPRQLSQMLLQKGWTYRRACGRAALGYQDKITAGLLEHKPTRLRRPLCQLRHAPGQSLGGG
ncbi:BRO family protein [Acetobacteraceae bacterium KSS12]|uniref:BRO family protein n=2 Tax=Rhizosaccharibacter radicis TaxID=2782605 RepID=A0ABT1VW20_9PROT|nr:BRO family protein [Acetobacteraceae bacterium KSS12]